MSLPKKTHRITCERSYVFVSRDKVHMAVNGRYLAWDRKTGLFETCEKSKMATTHFAMKPEGAR